MSEAWSRVINKACDLCEEARITPWFHEDELCWIAECEICAVPMVVWRNHSATPDEATMGELHARLAAVVAEHFTSITTSTTTCATSPTTTTPMPARSAASSATA